MQRQSRTWLSVIAAVLIGIAVFAYFRVQRKPQSSAAKAGTLIETGEVPRGTTASPTAIASPAAPAASDAKRNATLLKNESSAPPSFAAPPAATPDRKSRASSVQQTRAPAGTTANKMEKSPAPSQSTGELAGISVTVPGVSPSSASSPRPASPAKRTAPANAPSEGVPEVAISVAPAAPAPPPAPTSANSAATKPLYNGASSGTLRWSGVVEEGGVITIEGDRASTGTVNGALPGLPIQVELVSKHAAISEAPAPSNGWKRIAIRSLKRQTDLALKWTVLP
jgi:hypothetical protein